MLLAIKISVVLSRNNIFFQSSLFEIIEIETGAIKYTNITSTIFHIIAEEFIMFLPKNIFSDIEIYKFLVFKKTNAQDALATITCWAKNLLAIKVK